MQRKVWNEQKKESEKETAKERMSKIKREKEY